MNNHEVRVRTEDEKFEMVTSILDKSCMVISIALVIGMVFCTIFG